MLLLPYNLPCPICDNTMFLEFSPDGDNWISVTEDQPHASDEIRMCCDTCGYTQDPLSDPDLRKKTELLKMKITQVLVESGHYTWSKNN